MNLNLNKNQIERFSRQIILKNIGVLGQKKILNSKVLIIGMGGLGCPVAEFLARSGIGTIGIVDDDIVNLSNIHRQSLYDEKDLGRSKVKVAQKKLEKINSKTKVNFFNYKLDKKNPCLRCFYQEENISDDILNCEYEGILGTIAGVVGTIQANEILKKIINIGQNLNGFILILDLLNLSFRKVKINKRKK